MLTAQVKQSLYWFVRCFWTEITICFLVPGVIYPRMSRYNLKDNYVNLNPAARKVSRNYNEINVYKPKLFLFDSIVKDKNRFRQAN